MRNGFRDLIQRPTLDIAAMPQVSWSILRRSPSTYLVLGLIVALWGLVVAGRILWNGYVYDLDYSLWFPDGTFYAYRAFVWAGYSPNAATASLNSMYEPLGVHIPPGLPEKPPIYDSRILYSALSTPFVALMGVYGLLVVPSLGLLAGVIVPAIMLLRRGLALPAFLLSGLALASTSLARWSVANLTDAVLLGLFALMLPLLPWRGEALGWRRITGLVVVSVAVALTRQALPILILAVALPWLSQGIRSRRWKSSWLVALGSVALPSVVLAILTLPRDSFWLVPISQDAGGLSGISPQDRILRFPVEMIRMTVIELGQLAVLDRALLLLLILSIGGALVSWRSYFAASWLGVVIGSVIVTAWVGASGVNFRYSMQVVPLSIIVASALWTSKFRSPSGQSVRVE